MTSTQAEQRLLDDAIWNLVQLDQDGRVIDARRLKAEIMERYGVSKIRATSAIARVARRKRNERR